MKLKLESMQALYIEQLADLLNAENQLLKALPKAVIGAGSKELRNALTSHLEETKGHVERIEKIFEGLEMKPPAHKCAAMEGLIEEGKEILDADGVAAVKDAAIIAAAQRMEHYEIAGYGCARTFARILGRDSDAEELQTTLDEEYAADQKLTEIAESSINEKASQA